MSIPAKIEYNLPPELEQYIKEFTERPNFTAFALGKVLFKLIEHDGYFKLIANKKEYDDILTSNEEIFSLIKEIINQDNNHKFEEIGMICMKADENGPSEWEITK